MTAQQASRQRLTFLDMVFAALPTSECVPWPGYLDENGYGMTGVPLARKTARAHRYVYEVCVGTIGPGLQLDHLCHTVDPTCTGGRRCAHRACVNPVHLEQVTGHENTARSPFTIPSIHRAKDCCPQGHRYDEVNTVSFADGDRRCRTCRVEEGRIRTARDAAAWRAAGMTRAAWRAAKRGSS